VRGVVFGNGEGERRLVGRRGSREKAEKGEREREKEGRGSHGRERERGES